MSHQILSMSGCGDRLAISNDSRGQLAERSVEATRLALKAELDRAFNPLSTVEELVVEEIARRAAQLRDLDRAMATHTIAAQDVLQAVVGSVNPASQDLLAAASLASDEQRQLAALSLAESRAMLGGIQMLTTLTYQRTVESSSALAVPDPRFASEQACSRYLVRRFRTGHVACAKCHQPGPGHWLAHNRAWQCARCDAQTGIRRGTVMARSQIALVTWFQAIRISLLRPQTATSELAAGLGITRTGTVRVMRHRIEQALKSADASLQLADLDQAFLGCG